MDIIIRNGVIQTNESKRVHEIKNNAGLLKKDYRDFVKGIPGPYYDFFDSHVCVPRKYNQIQNFSGPQDKKKIKYSYLYITYLTIKIMDLDEGKISFWV